MSLRVLGPKWHVDKISWGLGKPIFAPSWPFQALIGV